MSVNIYQMPLDQITIKDIEELISNKITENHWLEFKRNLWLPSEAKGGNNDLAAKVSKELVGFANADGGTLILGLTEEEGTAAALDPIEGAAEKLDRLMRSLNDPHTIDPPLGLIENALISCTEGGGHVLMLRVERSLNKPHRACRDQNRVFVRRGEESRPISMGEIKDLILFNEFRGSRIRDRLDQMLTDYRGRAPGGPDYFSVVAVCAPVEPLPVQINLDGVGQSYRLLSKLGDKSDEEFGQSDLLRAINVRSSHSLIGGRISKSNFDELALFRDGSMWAGSVHKVKIEGSKRKVDAWEMAGNIVQLLCWLGTIVDTVGDGRASVAVQVAFHPAEDCTAVFGYHPLEKGEVIHQLQRSPVYSVSNWRDLNSIATALWQHFHEALGCPLLTRGKIYELERV